MSSDWATRPRVAGALVVALLGMSTLVLGGCSVPVADLPLGGTSADESSHSKEAAYPPVNELPPDREETAMSPAERAKVQSELLAARERQSAPLAAKDPAAK